MREARHQHVEQVCTWPDVARFHFLDETGLRLDYARTHGRAVGGAVSVCRGPSLTLIGALSVRGLGAVQVLKGALKQRSFALYVAHCLAPTLRPGDVVLDNLAVYKLSGLREWLAKRGVDVMFLSPYSPDFSPIEQAWSKLKTKLRTGAARSYEALQTALHEAIDWISSRMPAIGLTTAATIPNQPEKWVNCLRNCYNILLVAKVINRVRQVGGYAVGAGFAITVAIRGAYSAG